MSEYEFLKKTPLNFEINREPRCACVLLLDTSASMSGEPIRALNEGIALFADAIKQDRLASLRVEPLVITFDNLVTVHGDFITADQFNPPLLEAQGLTNMGQGILKALEVIEDRKAQYRAGGVRCFRPWIVLITDGRPTDDDEGGAFSQAVKAVRASESDKTKRVAFFAVGVEEADMSKLAEISIRKPKKLKGLAFNELFLWLSTSLIKGSSESPEVQSKLPDTTWEQA